MLSRELETGSVWDLLPVVSMIDFSCAGVTSASSLDTGKRTAQQRDLLVAAVVKHMKQVTVHRQY